MITTSPAARQVAHLGLAVGLLALSARMAFPIPGSDVPISLQSLAVFLVGIWLPTWLAGGAVLAYVALGVAGLPIFAMGKSGLAVLLGPSGGFLGGFVVCAFMLAASREQLGEGKLTPQTTLWVKALIIGLCTLVLLGLGAAWMAYALGVETTDGFQALLARSIVPLLPGALVKGVLAWVVWAFSCNREKLSTTRKGPPKRT